MAVLQSIQPKWCEMIISGLKTVEIRKTRPKCETPFKVYIYCTKSKEHFTHGGIVENLDDLYRMPNGIIRYGYSGELMCCGEPYGKDNFLNGKVIGEYSCEQITFLGNISTDPWCHLLGNVHEQYKRLVNEQARLTERELLDYGGKYAWHISDLVIYDKPKELSEFFYACKQPKGTDCAVCLDRRENNCKSITRPPQSWCYVEEREG